ncbi:MAG: SLC13 family permease [Candidatus Neomarinimicrobiota bacterium]
MTVEIIFVLALLGLAVLFFVTEWLRVDLVAGLVLLVLAITGIISHDAALAGFSNHAVITIAAVLVLSAGLHRTGVAHIIGHQILRLAGTSKIKLLIIMMATVALFSGIMNNIGVAALLLPVVLEIARRTRQSPSKLLIPLAFASLLGGLVTLIGTAPNILINSILQDAGFAGFSLFDFTPLGLIVVASGIFYMVVFGRHLLPDRDLGRETSLGDMLTGQYGLDQRLITLHIPEGSPLAGRSLAGSRLGAALGFNVMAIIRGHTTFLAPGPEAEIHAGDKLLVEGRRENLEMLREWRQLELKSGILVGEHELAAAMDFAEFRLADNSPLLGKTLKEAGFRSEFAVNILGAVINGQPKVVKLSRYRLNDKDLLIAMGHADDIRLLADQRQLTDYRRLRARDLTLKYKLHRQMIGIGLPAGSQLAGRTIAESRMKDALGINVLAVQQNGGTVFMPAPDQVIRERATLIVLGMPEVLETLRGLQSLEIDTSVEVDLDHLESDQVGAAEITLAPRTLVVGKTLGMLQFREKYGLSVLAIWRRDRAFRTNLRDQVLEPGDALLVYGRREQLARLQKDADFLVLSGLTHELYKKEKAPLAGAIEVGVLTTVALGWLPIYIAAPAGAAAMVLSGCLTMDEAYKAIEWKAIVLIAGMLGLGVAMQGTGTTEFLARHVMGALESFGHIGVVAGLFTITCVLAQIMPTAAVAVIMAPLALTTAVDFGLSPQALLMVVAVGSSSSFLSPVGHPVNLLVMGLGGYRFTDYTRVGLPLVLILLAISLFILPLLWPLTG